MGDSIRRISNLMEEYEELFGEESLGFSDNLNLARDELNKLLDLKKKQTQRKEDSCSVTLPDASERLVEYDRYVEQQKKHKSQASGSDISLVGYDAQTSEHELKKSRLELIAEERDMKRRRQNYKGSKTHTGKKSYTEVLREVIEKQSHFLQTTMANSPRTGSTATQ